MKPLFELDRTQVHRLMDPSCGAFSTPLTYDIREMAAIATKAQPSFKQAASERLVSNYSYRCIDPVTESIWTGFAGTIASELNRELRSFIDIPERIEFDDLYFTNYHESPMGVGPHRDVNCKNLVVVLILQGNPAFFVCKDKDLSGSLAIPSAVGELMIMRARSFLDLEGPLHYVGAIKPGMLQFGMRQYINKPQK